jgi:hypothetical protein
MCSHHKAPALLLGVLYFITYVNAASKDSVDAAIYWDSGALHGIRDAKLGAPVVAHCPQPECGSN